MLFKSFFLNPSNSLIFQFFEIFLNILKLYVCSLFIHYFVSKSDLMSDNYYWNLGLKSEDYAPRRSLINQLTSIFRPGNNSEALDLADFDIDQNIQFQDTTDNLTTTLRPWPGRGNYGQTLFGTHARLGWVGFSAPITGWLILIFFCILAFFALPFIRRKGYFQVRS